MTIKTFADLKRDIKIGDNLIMIDSALDFKGNKSRFIDVKRPISIIQTNSIAMTTLKDDGATVNSWLYWPKASLIDYFIDDDNQKRFKIYELDKDNNKFLSLEYAILSINA